MPTLNDKPSSPTATSATPPTSSPPPAAGAAAAKAQSPEDEALRQKNAEAAGELTQEQQRAAVERRNAVERAQLERPKNREGVYFNDNGSIRPAIVAHVHDPLDEDPDAGYVNLSVLNEDGTWQAKQKVRRGDHNGQWSHDELRASSSSSAVEKTATTAKALRR